MLAPALQRRMNLLALVAMLLLVALPTTGRLLAGPPDPGGVWAQICTMAGLKLVKIAPGDSNPLDPGPDPTPPAGTGMAADDCAYCPVLAGMAILLLCMVVATLAASRRASAPWRLDAPRVFPHPGGLGSRGPPLVL